MGMVIVVDLCWLQIEVTTQIVWNYRGTMETKRVHRTEHNRVTTHHGRGTEIVTKLKSNMQREYPQMVGKSVQRNPNGSVEGAPLWKTLCNHSFLWTIHLNDQYYSRLKKIQYSSYFGKCMLHIFVLRIQKMAVAWKQYVFVSRRKTERTSNT